MAMKYGKGGIASWSLIHIQRSTIKRPWARTMNYIWWANQFHTPTMHVNAPEPDCRRRGLAHVYYSTVYIVELQRTYVHACTRARWQSWGHVAFPLVELFVNLLYGRKTRKLAPRTHWFQIHGAILSNTKCVVPKLLEYLSSKVCCRWQACRLMVAQNSEIIRMTASGQSGIWMRCMQCYGSVSWFRRQEGIHINSQHQSHTYLILLSNSWMPHSDQSYQPTPSTSS